VSVVDVAFPGNGSCAELVASVPQERTPAVDALTSQLALFKLETMSCEVEARPETESSVVDAFWNVWSAVNVFAAYVFGMVVEASMKKFALVVDQERPCPEK
jgi:hypothetical protein